MMTPTTLGKTSEPILAEAVPERLGKQWLWRIAKCPFCGKKHIHGGTGPEPDGGHRASHCTGGSGNYYLQERAVRHE